MILLLGMVFSQPYAQYQIKKYSINSGGGTSIGSIYQVSGSIAQVDASNKLTGNNYSLIGGFWHESNDVIFKNGFE